MAFHCHNTLFNFHLKVKGHRSDLNFGQILVNTVILLHLQALELVRLGLMFPVYCFAYMIAPTSSSGHFMKNPFVKFICHSASFLCFLMLLACASQRLEQLTMQVKAKSLCQTSLFSLVGTQKKVWEKTSFSFSDVFSTIYFKSSLLQEIIKLQWRALIRVRTIL